MRQFIIHNWGARKFLGVVFCNPCNFITSDLGQMRCPNGHVMMELSMTQKEVMNITKVWN